MKVLSHLDIGFNEIGDVGISEIVRALKEHSSVEYLDVSGNCIGKSGSAMTQMDCADALVSLMTQNGNLEVFKADWNNLRGNIGEKVVEALS